MAEYKGKFERSSFGVGQYNMQTIQALHKKYRRDYLPFFQELFTMYKIGKNKKEIEKTINLVKKVQALLKDTIQEGRIEKDDTETLYRLVEEIEQQKQYFLEEVQNVKAFQERISKVEQSVGISLGDLNVTKNVVQAGVARSRQKSETTRSLLKRTAPTTYGLASQAVQAIGTAGLGPFYGIAKTGLGIGSDIWNIRKGLMERKQKSLEASLRSGIRTSGSHVPSSETVSAARMRSPDLGGFGGLGRAKSTIKEQTAPLNEFFDKGAYKAKWTKELLRNSKAAKKGRMGFLGDLKNGIIPLVGKLVLLTAGIGNAIIQFKRLGTTITGWRDAKKSLEESKRAMASAAGTGQGTWEQELLKREDPIAALKKYKMEGKIAPQIAAQIEKRMAPDYVMAHKKSVEWRKDADDVKAMTEKITGRLGIKEKGKKESPPELKLPPVPGIDDLNNNLKELTEQLKRGQLQEASSMRQGSVFDSADAIVNNHANGNMTLGDN